MNSSHEMIGRFLSARDADRALKAMAKLARHDISRWALTGGLALEIHSQLRGRTRGIRTLNDLDFVAETFDCIPPTLADDFLCRHVHPLDPPGKTILQLVDPETCLRIDLFRACGETMSRTIVVELESVPVRIVSAEDLTARSARLVLDLGENIPAVAKHAEDYLRLTELVAPPEAEAAWRDHRKQTHPTTFSEADTMLRQLIAARPDLLIDTEYSKDPSGVCPRCVSMPAFPLAKPEAVLALLGYC